jgi:hypothetical protein
MARHQRGVFLWGTFDCATLFSDAVAAVTGEDPLAAFRPWHSERTALVALLKSGKDSVADWVADNFDEIVPADARRGDVGYAKEALQLSFPAIVCGSIAMSRDESGWIVFPRTQLVRCFKVG